MKGYCAPYNGAVCRNYIVGRGLVWFNISQDNAGGWRNEEITSAIKEELINSYDRLQREPVVGEGRVAGQPAPGEGGGKDDRGDKK